jgi:hypothetical protein
VTANAKGAAFERALVDWFRANGVDAVRVHDGGTRDEGDLRVTVFHVGLDNEPLGVCIQAKNYRNLADAINNGLRDLDDQVANAGTRVGCVIARRHGKPDPGDSVIVFRLADWVEGWG